MSTLSDVYNVVVSDLFVVPGSQTVDNIFQVLLSTSMFVGGVTGFFLDNTIPGKNYCTKLCLLAHLVFTITFTRMPKFQPACLQSFVVAQLVC